MAVYGRIQAHELGYWLNALIHAAYDPRRPLSNVHGGLARARTARQDLLDIAGCYRSNHYGAEHAAAVLSRWCSHYLDETEWYRLTGEPREAPLDAAADTPDASRDTTAESPGRYRVG